MRHYPVVIVGAGPTGLTLANLLGQYGVTALVLERNADTVKAPRAVSIDDEALRIMQAAGLDGTLEGHERSQSKSTVPTRRRVWPTTRFAAASRTLSVHR